MAAQITIKIDFPENDLRYDWIFEKAAILECYIQQSLAKQCNVDHGHGTTKFSVSSETKAISPYKEKNVESTTGTGVYYAASIQPNANFKHIPADQAVI